MPEAKVMTPEAKSQLSKTIRSLRERLLVDLEDALSREYKLAVDPKKAKLSHEQAQKRARLDAWVDEQVRALGPKAKKAEAVTRFRADVVKKAAYTLLNRLIYLRLLEATELRKVPLVTGGWKSRGYQDFRDLAPALTHDATEGYALLLNQVFEELSLDLPGLFGSAGMADLVPTPAATLRHAIETLDDPALESCWTDDMTLGWVYQYWNDPEREGLDLAVKERNHKIQRHEVASKTQMFTDRYIAEWLLQNSLGRVWMQLCRANGWTPEVVANGTLTSLDERRTAARAQAERDGTALELPLHSADDHRWQYYLPSPQVADAVEGSPTTLRNFKLLDPAVGSGHFLVLALELLFHLYKEEARHRGEEHEPKWSDSAIVDRIVETNLHGVDIDPRAIQIAGAALWLKARSLAQDASPKELNLAAAALQLSDLPEDDAALEQLRLAVEAEAGIPAGVTQDIIATLQLVDHLGSLSKLGDSLERIVANSTASRAIPQQGSLIGEAFPEPQLRADLTAAEARLRLEGPLETFLAAHTGTADVGVRLRGQQLASGVRLMRMLRDASYDLVVMNPPYHSASKLAKNASEWQKLYPSGRADLFASFILRSFELLRPGGLTASVTLSNWMFLKAFADFRVGALETRRLVLLGDLGKGAFSSGSNLISASAQIFENCASSPGRLSVALRTFSDGDGATDTAKPERTAVALACHVGRHEFAPAALKVVPEWPLVYWWDQVDLGRFVRLPLVQDESDVCLGVTTGSNARFLRSPWELRSGRPSWERFDSPKSLPGGRDWEPYIKGAGGKAWQEPLSDSIRWSNWGLELKVSSGVFIRNENYFFSRGVAFSTIGVSFRARLHRYPSVFDVSGSSVFPGHPAAVCALLNSTSTASLMSSLNPTVNFQVGDVKRIPLEIGSQASEIIHENETAFTTHESHREPSVEFLTPGPSPWRYAQDWAQRAVDRPEGEPLPPYEEQLDPEPPTDHVSFALGVALGRFGPKGQGILDPDKDDLSHAYPGGLLFLDGTRDPMDPEHQLRAPAGEPILMAWADHGPHMDCKADQVTDYLRLEFFKDVHKSMYENRPIHWPLSSEKKTFVAWVNIHRWDANTLRLLIAEHLNPAMRRIDGRLDDLRSARDSGDTKAARSAEKTLGNLQKHRDELAQFITDVEQCAERGPLPPDTKTPPREVDAAYDPDLDDGVMINSAALYPLLAPQWKEPKKWWTEMAKAKGRKDYDWSHLAMRYWPTRVDAKCKEDPSLGVAHGCFWKYHPERAYAWELRLQDEIEAGFTIDEADSDACRAAFLKDHPDKTQEAVSKETKRRERKAAKQAKADAAAAAQPGVASSPDGPLFQGRGPK